MGGWQFWVVWQFSTALQRTKHCCRVKHNYISQISSILSGWEGGEWVGGKKKITLYVINIVIIDCSIKVYGAIAAGSISYSFSYPQITDADQQEHHLSLVPPPAIPPSPAHANSISPDPACAIAPALAFFLHPQSTYIRHYLIIVQYLQPILRWILRGDTLALQSFSPLRASFPQKLKHCVTCSATIMETTEDSRWPKFTAVLTETTLSFATRKEAAPAVTSSACSESS